MANFDEAVDLVLKQEGGSKITNDINDKGGLTKYGISQRAYPKLNIENLKEGGAKRLYRIDYWQPLALDNEPDQAFANIALSFAVNMGVYTTKSLLDAVKDKTGDARVYGLKLCAIAHYVAICRNNPQQRKFLLGWINRALGG